MKTNVISSGLDPQIGSSIGDSIAAANKAMFELLLPVSSLNDRAAARLLSMSNEVMAVFPDLRIVNLTPVTTSSHWALFKPRLPSVADIRSLPGSGYDHPTIEKMVQKQLSLQIERRKLSPSVAKLISTANKMVFEAYVACAASGDPVAPVLLGVEPAYLEAFGKLVKSQTLAAFDSLILPLFALRYDNMTVMKAVCENGCTDPVVQCEMLKSIAPAN